VTSERITSAYGSDTSHVTVMSRVNAPVWGQTVDLVPWESTLYSQVVSVYTARFNIQQFHVLPTQCIFVWISEQTAIISLYRINWLICITETEYVYCAVRIGSLYVILYQQVQHSTTLPSAHTVYFCVDLRTNSDYFPIKHWLVFITETECVYCAVRTGSVNIIAANVNI
jgi:hypothetical protein